MKTPILGADYDPPGSSASNLLINLYPRIIAEGGAEASYLTGVHGAKLIPIFRFGGTTSNNVLTVREPFQSPVRGLHSTEQGLFVVSGNTLVLYKQDAGFILSSHIKDDGGLVSMVHSQTQMVMVSAGERYVVDLSFDVSDSELIVYGNNNISNLSGGFAKKIEKPNQIPDFGGFGTVCYLNNTFIFSELGSDRLWASETLDGSAIDPLDFASSEGAVDKIVTIGTSRNELWVFSSNSIEVWNWVGGLSFPMLPNPSSFSEIGILSKNTLSKIDDSFYWVGRNREGTGSVYRNRGYQIEQVGTLPIVQEIQSYTDFSKMRSYSYSYKGHSFYVLSMPDESRIFALDASTGVWHRRQHRKDNDFVKDPLLCHELHQDQHYFGGSTWGIYTIDDSISYTQFAERVRFTRDAAAPTDRPPVLTMIYDHPTDVQSRWVRAWRAMPTGQNEMLANNHHSLVVSIAYPENINFPWKTYNVALRWSDDHGRTWSKYNQSMSQEAGPIVNFRWTRLGHTKSIRDRVYEISGNHPFPIDIIGAELVVSPTNRF